jgi:protein involved in polysaccharide export with SLBB domain
MTGAASASVAVLVQYVLRRMMIMKLKTTATGLLLIGLGAAGVILAASQTGPSRTPPAPSRGPRAQAKASQKSAAITQAATKKVQPALQPLESYVVEPPDMILVEVLEALPGRPISGERLVRSDGEISLGFYGDVYVAGLTVPEVKEKIVLHLRKYISDETLGLLEVDPETLEVKRDKNGRFVVKDPRDIDRVFVDVTAYNSKNYYVQGAVKSPGRLPITGHDTVLDAINFVGGLTPRADRDKVVLYRKGKGGVLQSLPIDIAQITMGDDPTTNYQLLPGDRLVIPARPDAHSGDESPLEVRPSIAVPNLTEEMLRMSRKAAPPVRDPAPGAGAPRREPGGDDRPALRDLERRLGEVERKLDRILEDVQRRGP